MASSLVDLVKINVSNTGSGAITLGSAVEGYRGREVLTNGTDYSYSIQQGSAWEFGRGTYLSSGNQFIRSPIDSSDGGTAIALKPNAQVAFTAISADLMPTTQLTADIKADRDAAETARDESVAAKNIAVTKAGEAADSATAADADAATTAVLAYLASNPFADTDELEAYSNAALAVGMSTTIVGDGRYEVASLGPVVWTRTGDSDGKRAGDEADRAAASEARMALFSGTPNAALQRVLHVRLWGNIPANRLIKFRNFVYKDVNDRTLITLSLVDADGTSNEVEVCRYALDSGSTFSGVTVLPLSATLIDSATDRGIRGIIVVDFGNGSAFGTGTTISNAVGGLNRRAVYTEERDDPDFYRYLASRYGSADLFVAPTSGYPIQLVKTLEDRVVSLALAGVTDPTKRYFVDVFGYRDSGTTRMLFVVGQSDADGVSNKVQVCRYSLGSGASYSTKQGFFLSEMNGSGISGYVVIDFSDNPTLINLEASYTATPFNAEVAPKAIVPTQPLFDVMMRAGPAVSRPYALVAAIGDSRHANGILSNAPSFGRTMQSAWSWIEFLSYGRIRCPASYNKAVGGTSPSDLDGQITNILALSPRPSHCVILSGTNAINNAASAAGLLAGMQASFVEAWARLRRNGIVPVQVLDLPRQWTTTTLTAAAKRLIHASLNQWLRATAPGQGCLLIDPVWKLTDPANSNGECLTSLYYPESPAIHPGPTGGIIVGQIYVDQFLQTLNLPPRYLGRGRGDIYDAINSITGNLIPEGGLAVSGGGSLGGGNPPTGTVPLGWILRNDTGTANLTSCVGSLVARTDGPGNRFRVAATATGAATVLIYGQGSYNCAVGDTVQFAIDSILTDATGLIQHSVSLAEYASNLSTINRREFGMQFGTVASIGAFPTSWDGRAICDPMTLSASFSQIRWGVSIEFGASGGSFTADLAAPELRKVV